MLARLNEKLLTLNTTSIIIKSSLSIYSVNICGGKICVNCIFNSYKISNCLDIAEKLNIVRIDRLFCSINKTFIKQWC